jgi:peptidoglycan-N-acetylglucosamine deacetylase
MKRKAMLAPFPMIICGASLVAGTTGVYYATYAVRSQWLGPTDWHGRRDTRSVALTFDDGPSVETEDILEVLAKHSLRATFFMIGKHAEQLRRIARDVASSGHEIGNHSYSHHLYLFRTSHDTTLELQHTQDVISGVTGVRPLYARPPYGVRTPAYFVGTQALGLRTVQWEVAGFDWKNRTAQRIAYNVLDRVKAGSIILLHDGDSEGKRNRRQTVLALPLIIDGLRSRSLEIVPLAELLCEEQGETARVRKIIDEET